MRLIRAATATRPDAVAVLVVCGGGGSSSELVDAGRRLLLGTTPTTRTPGQVAAIRYDGAGLVHAPSAGVVVRERHHGSLERPRLESHVLALAHPCLACAVREDLALAMHAAIDAGARGVAVILPPGLTPDVAMQALAHRPGTEEAGNVSTAWRLHGVVTVADAGTWLEDAFGRERLSRRGWQLLPADTGGVADVVAGQAEGADALVLLNSWLLPPAYTQQLRAALRQLAPDAALTFSVDGRIPVERVSGLPRQTAPQPGWKRLLAASDSELSRTGAVVVHEAGICSVAWRARPPVHRDRLLEAVPELVLQTLRGSGHFWFPQDPDEIVEWDHTGRKLRLAPGGTWAAAHPRGAVPKCASTVRRLSQQWHPRYGDRLQELVLVGYRGSVRNGEPRPLQLLRECLLEDDPSAPLDWSARRDDSGDH